MCRNTVQKSQKWWLVLETISYWFTCAFHATVRFPQHYWFMSLKRSYLLFLIIITCKEKEGLLLDVHSSQTNKEEMFYKIQCSSASVLGRYLVSFRSFSLSLSHSLYIYIFCNITIIDYCLEINSLASHVQLLATFLLYWALKSPKNERHTTFIYCTPRKNCTDKNIKSSCEETSC